MILFYILQVVSVRNRKFYKQVAAYLAPGDFFVNLGANDGVTNDPIFAFIETFGLKGIAVEPIGITYRRLCENYQCFRDVICERVAVYSGVVKPIYRLRDDLLALAPVLTQSSSVDREQLLVLLDDFRRGRVDPALYEKIRRDAIDPTIPLETMLQIDEDVVYLTFGELMARHNVSRVDFLNVDIEGCDFEVFMSMDLDRLQTKVLIIETRLFTEEQQVAFAARIQAAGFLFLQKFDYYSEVYARLR